MTNLRDHLQEIQNTSDETTIGNFTFRHKYDDQYQIVYNGFPIVKESITTNRLNEYEQVAKHYDTWNADEDLPDIGNWDNLYGDPYWRYKNAQLQLRTAGAIGKRSYTNQIKSPEYFNPDCLSKYHRSEDSAILTMLLILVRFTPEEAAYRHHHQKTIIDQLQEIKGIGEKTANTLYNKGVRDYPDVKENITTIERAYRSEAHETITNKIEQDTHLLEETGFLDKYGDQHLANKI